MLEDDKLRDTLKGNINHLVASEKVSKRQAIYNIRINSVNLSELITKLEDIFLKQTKAFKINVSFSFILRNSIDGSYRFYYGSSNNSLLTQPQVIADREGFDQFVQILRDQDILESMREQRPNSKLSFYLVTNMVVKLTYLDFTIGSRVQLPDYILNHRSIIALARDRNNNKPYDDNLCFFRALSLHNGCHVKNLEKCSKHYFRSYLSSSGMKEHGFQGIDLSELPELELLF